MTRRMQFCILSSQSYNKIVLKVIKSFLNSWIVFNYLVITYYILYINLKLQTFKKLKAKLVILRLNIFSSIVFSILTLNLKSI